MMPLVPGAPGMIFSRPDPLLGGLVEWWWLDSANAGTGANGAFNLTTVGTVTRSGSGGPGGLGFSSTATGTAASNYYELAHNSAFGLATYSVSCWARNTDANNRRIFIKGTGINASNAVHANLRAFNAPERVGPVFRPDEGGNITSPVKTTAHSGWNHYVFVRSSAGVIIYMDGVSHDTKSAGTASSNTEPLRLMTFNASGSAVDLALFGWWNRVLTVSEVERLYDGGPASAPLTPTDIGL